jgi:hypothetical protein
MILHLLHNQKIYVEHRIVYFPICLSEHILGLMKTEILKHILKLEINYLVRMFYLKQIIIKS